MLFSSSATGGSDGSSSAAAAAVGGGLGWPMTSFVIFAIIGSSCCNAMSVGEASELARDKNFSPELVLPEDVQRESELSGGGSNSRMAAILRHRIQQQQQQDSQGGRLSPRQKLLLGMLQGSSWPNESSANAGLGDEFEKRQSSTASKICVWKMCPHNPW